jgi:hypothetical protein
VRDWRSTAFRIAITLIVVEFCFLVYSFRNEGAPAHRGPSRQTLAMASAAPAPDQASAAPAPPARATPMVAPLATATSVVTRNAPAKHVVAAPVPQHLVAADVAEFQYEGHWEHIAGKHDGRAGGKSSRTFAHGARATLHFHGRFVRLYGVLGPGGGYGAIRLDGAPGKLVDFFSASKAAHRLVYASPELPLGSHRLTLAVVPDPKIAGARTQYVNIDGAEYGS